MKQKIFLSALILIALLSACRKVIPFDAEYQKVRLVINTMLCQDDQIEVDLSTSRIIIDNAPTKKVSGATIELYQNGNYVETLKEEEFKYVSTHKVEAGATYSLKASANLYDPVECQTVMPKKIEILDLDTVTTMDEENIEQLNFTLRFPQDPNVNEYFMIKAYVERVWADSNGQENIYFDNLYINSNDVIAESDFHGAIVFSDKLMNNEIYTFSGNFDSGYFYDTLSVKVMLFSINEDMYRYFVSYDINKDAQGDPMMEPTMVYSNVSSGMGIMGGAAISVDSFMVYPRNNN